MPRHCVPRQKVEKLRSSLHFLDAPRQNTHTLFLDDEKEVETFTTAKHFDTAPELADRAYNRTRRKTLESTPVVGPTDRKSLKKLRKKRNAAYAELESRVERVEKISRTASHMELQKKLSVSRCER